MSQTQSESDIERTLRVVRGSKLIPQDKEKICRLLLLISTPAEQMTGAQLGEARRAAGLSIIQAARLLEVPPTTLAAIEDGLPDGGLGGWAPGLCDRMNDVYGLGPREQL